VKKVNQSKETEKNLCDGWNWTLFHEVGIRDDADSLHLLLGMRIAALLPVKSETKGPKKPQSQESPPKGCIVLRMPVKPC
jgi:hypothetical protein